MKNTTVAYRCPHCGAGVMSAVNALKLAGNMVRLRCSCGKSEMIVEPTKDGKFSLQVPCLICPRPHEYKIGAEFLDRDLFTLHCPYGEDVVTFFMGDANLVKSELARTELSLLKIMEENGISDFSALHGDSPEMSDPARVQEVLLTVRELQADGKIHCDCKETSYDFDVETRGDVVLVCCVVFYAYRFLLVDAWLVTESIIYAEALYLTKENKQ